ncbi:MAG: hypothetical protein ACK2TV_01995 [Anaerolineales bacterium]
MQSFQYAFRFIAATFSLSKNDKELRRNWLTFILGSVIIFIFWLLALVAVIYFIKLKLLNSMLVGLIAFLVILSWLVWGKINALRTCAVFTNLIQERQMDTETETQAKRAKGHWFDAVLFALSMPGLKIIAWFRQILKKDDDKEALLLDAYHLILPVIELENLNLSQATARVKEMVQEKSLRFRSDLVRIRLLGGLLQWFLILVGILISILINLRFADPITASLRRRLFFLGVGMASGAVPATLGILFNDFTRACYHTTLYQWVRNIETARKTGAKDQASAPNILQQVFYRKK